MLVDMPDFQQLETEKAIAKWNSLALNNTAKLTIAHNPSLFYFFSGYLKLPSFYIILTQNDQVAGLLPLVKIGKKIVSVPHFSYGGILWLSEAKDEFDEGQIIKHISHQLINEKALSGFYTFKLEEIPPVEPGADYPVEVRKTVPLFGAAETNKVMLFMPLKKNDDAQRTLFNTNLRRKINKAEKNGIEIRRGGEELVADYTKVYNRNMQSIGSPSLGNKFFRSLCLTENSNTEIFVAYFQGRAIGGGFCMWYDGFYENIWFSTLQDYNKLYTSYLLHDVMIKSAVQKKATVYSMGRSTKGSGAHRYKQQWPVEEKDLFFSNSAETSFSLKDQKWMSEIWKRLPAFFVDAVGPYFAKRLY